MPVKLAALLLYDEWKSRPRHTWVQDPNLGYGALMASYPRDDYLSFLKTQAVDSTAKGHAAYKLVVKWIRDGKFIRD